MKNKDFHNLHLQLSKEDIVKIDGWKKAKGMKSRSEAIRSIIHKVTDDEFNIVGIPSSTYNFGEKSASNYTSPQVGNDIEGLVRKIIHEELKKIDEKTRKNH